MSEHEAKIQKFVDDAFTKLTAKVPITSEQSSEVKEFLLNLALRSTMVGAPTKCKECEDALDPRYRDRCVKHIGLLMAADYGKAKVREHGPALATKMFMGLQGWFEKVTAEDEKKQEDSSAES